MFTDTFLIKDVKVEQSKNILLLTGQEGCCGRLAALVMLSIDLFAFISSSHSQLINPPPQSQICINYFQNEIKMFEEDNEGEVDNVMLRFTIPRGKSEITVSEGLSFAFQVCQRFGLMIDWIQEERLLEMLRGGWLAESSVVVVDPFYGETFSELCRHCRAGKVTVLGPSCLVSCLQRNMAVPATPYPVYSSALRGLVVTSSGLETGEMDKARELVEAMSGQWSGSLHEGVTHLVTASVLSEKYRVAASLGLVIMRLSWLEDVWKCSESAELTGEDQAFSIHEVPSLLGVRVCVSQLGRQDRDLLRRGVEGAGGELSGLLDIETDVLVCVREGGEKWSAAKRWGIPCVTTAWILDSLEQGKCLDTTLYRVEVACQETPAREGPTRLPDMDRSQSLSKPQEMPDMDRSQSLSLPQERPRSLLHSLQLSEIKNAGTFLDGCTVFLAVSDREEENKLARILKHAGAVRLSQLTERVTHVVQDTLQGSHATAARVEELDISPAMVDVGWVVASMKAGRPVMAESAMQAEHEPQESSYDTTANTFTTSVDNSNFEEDLLAYYR